MTIEQIILIAIACISFLSFLFIPKSQLRKAFISVLVFQATTWCTAIILAQGGNIQYPVREFVKATQVNFIPQFIFYPTIFMWFILLFPQTRSIFIKITHYILFVSIMVWFIYLTSQYTDLHRFPNGSDLSMILKGYLRNTFQFAVCHLYITWFFRKEINIEG